YPRSCQLRKARCRQPRAAGRPYTSLSTSSIIEGQRRRPLFDFTLDRASGMRYSLPYGPEASLALELPDAARVADYIAPHGTALGDTAEAVTAALNTPLDYPPLAAATVPGDRVVLAVEPGLRQVENV